MKRLKALIKMEIKPALLVGVLFLVANLIGFMQIQGRLTSSWKNYLEGGLSGYFSWYSLINIMGDTFFQAIFTVGVLYMILLIMLVFASFRYEKSVEISRFLKSLPYTERERCLVKIGVGIVISTIGMLVYLAGLMYLREYSMGLFQEIIEVTAIGNIVQEVFSLERLLEMLALTYVVLIAGYLFMVMVQYMISHRIGGIIIGILSAFAPLFMIVMSFLLFDISWDSWIGKIGNAFAYLMTNFIDYTHINFGVTDSYWERYTYVTGFGYHLAFYGVIIALSLIGILYFSKINQLENSDLLIPHPVVRVIFMVGVSICGGLSIGGLIRMFFSEILLTASSAPTMILFIIGAVISFLIAKKIAYIGIKKRKEVTP